MAAQRDWRDVEQCIAIIGAFSSFFEVTCSKRFKYVQSFQRESKWATTEDVVIQTYSELQTWLGFWQDDITGAVLDRIVINY